MTKVVAIDAGHGINTPGKRTPDDEREWSFNSIVAQSIIDNLKKYRGVKTVRLDDPTGKRDVPLQERTNKENNANADILVSRSEEHTSELQSRGHLVCRLVL